MPKLSTKRTRVLHRLKVLLKKLARKTTISRALLIRVRIILLAAKVSTVAIAAALHITQATARKWRKRWEATTQAFIIAMRKGETKRQLTNRIIEVLNDAYRSGAPQDFTPEQVTRIVQLACTPPSRFKRKTTRWTCRELALEAVKQEIVSNISSSTVYRLLNKNDVKPHQVKAWLNAAPEDPATFLPRVSCITTLYLQAKELANEGTRVACIDEKPGIQALEPLQPTLPMKPGLVERREFEYRRHGTTCLIASFDVVTAKIITSSVGPTRTEADYLGHIIRTIETDPNARWVIVTDQLNTHMSESLVRWVASKCGITADLGKKGKQGILKSMASRMAFLEDESHAIRFLYTPKHCSWLNQVECWFSILTRKILKNATFTSIDDLNQSIIDFIPYYNGTMAKPFNWTYTGRPLATA
jgi:transposase-like protein